MLTPLHLQTCSIIQYEKIIYSITLNNLISLIFITISISLNFFSISRCLDVVTRNINSYVEYLDYLPEYVKFRILVRVTKLKYGIHDDNVMKSLIQPGLRMLNFSSSTITDESLNIISQCKLMNRITFSKANYQMTSEGNCKI